MVAGSCIDREGSAGDWSLPNDILTTWKSMAALLSQLRQLYCLILTQLKVVNAKEVKVWMASGITFCLLDEFCTSA